MIPEKELLLDKIKQQRANPVTGCTFDLCQRFYDCIDKRNKDDWANYLFYVGECYFRIGNVRKSLNLLTRCLSTSKSKDLEYLNVYCYHIMGLINVYAGNETIALNYMLQCQTISEDLHLRSDLISSYINQGMIYHELGDYENAHTFLNTAYQQLNGLDRDFDSLYVLCESCRGVLLSQTENARAAHEIYQKLQHFLAEHTQHFFVLCLSYLGVHLHGYLADDAFLADNIKQLLSLPVHQDFLLFSRYYYACCSYLIEQGQTSYAAQILQKIEPEVRRGTLFFVKNNYLLLLARYTRTFDTENYAAVCCRLAQLHPSYEEEQHCITRHSLAYIELLRQTKIASDHFQEQSQLDQMTGLLNKYTIQFLIEEDLAKDHADRHAALLLVDLDHFKQINDTLGHLIGDEFICQTAKIIQKYFGDTALCGRVGGDEFLVYISSVADVSLIGLQAEMLLQEIERQTAQKHSSINACASLGIAFSSDMYHNYTRLFAAADRALYDAKTSGRNKIVIAE